MSEHLLKEEELARVVVAHQHLVIGECLTECMRCDMDVKSKLTPNFLQDPLGGVAVYRLIHVASPVTLASEHVVTQLNTICVLQVEYHGVDHRTVDRDVPVLWNLPCFAGLLLQNREGGLEPELFVDQVGEPQRKQIADAESKVDTNDEQHVVSVSAVIYEPFRDAVDIVDALDWFTGVFVGDLVGCILVCGCDHSAKHHVP